MENRNGVTPSRLRALLKPQERLLWWDIPRQGLMLRSKDIYRMPFSLLFVGAFFLWEGTAVSRLWQGERGVNPILMAVYGIPFVLAGLYALAGRFFHDAWRRSRTVYGLTDHRLLIARPSRPRSYDLATLGEIELIESSDNTGNIILGGDAYGSWQWNGEWIYRPAFEPRILEGIRNPAHVFGLIRSAQKDAQRQA
ncbi:MAG: hypothetical protein WBX25_10400 [Rhodomicrobium sp.]